MKFSKILRIVATVIVAIGVILFIYNEAKGDAFFGLAKHGEIIYISGLVLWIIGMFLETRDKKKEKLEG